jgi:hypothetical protein
LRAVLLRKPLNKLIKRFRILNVVNEGNVVEFDGLAGFYGFSEKGVDLLDQEGKALGAGEHDARSEGILNVGQKLTGLQVHGALLINGSPDD